MAIKAQPLTVTVTAWDTANNVPKTGDAANISIRLIKDGTGAARNDATAIAEVDATNAPGEYSVVLDATDMAADCVVVAGKSATSGVVVFGVKIITERGSVAAVKSDTAAILADTGTDGVVVADASKSGYSLAADQSGVTVGTVTDLTNAPTGMALEATLQAIKGAGWTAETLKALADAIAALNDLSQADAQSAAAAALSAYDPPTRTEATDDKAEIIAALPAAAPSAADIKAAMEAEGSKLYLIESDTSELLSRTPDAAPGAAGGLPVLDASAELQVTISEAQAEALATDIAAAIEVPPASVDEAALADAVWDEATTAHTTANTFGAGFASLLARFAAAVLQPIAAVTSTGDITVFRGVDYRSDLPTVLQLALDSTDFGDLSTATVTLRYSDQTWTGTIVDGNTASQVVDFEFTAEETAAMDTGSWPYRLIITEADGDVRHPVGAGVLTVMDIV